MNEKACYKCIHYEVCRFRDWADKDQCANQKLYQMWLDSMALICSLYEESANWHEPHYREEYQRYHDAALIFSLTCEEDETNKD
jgi:hypothetical protein